MRIRVEGGGACDRGVKEASDGSRSVIRAPPSLSTPVGRCLIKRDVKWGRSIKARPSDKFDSPDSRLIPRCIPGGGGGQDKTARFSGRSRFAEDIRRRMTDLGSERWSLQRGRGEGRERPFLLLLLLLPSAVRLVSSS